MLPKKTSKVTYQSWYSLNNFIKEEPSTLSLRMDAYKIPGLFYRSGMVQSWNRMRFTQAFLEFSARLSGYGNVPGCGQVMDHR